MGYLKHAIAKLGEDPIEDILGQIAGELSADPGVVFMFMPREHCHEDLADLLPKFFKCPIACCSGASAFLGDIFDDQSIVALSIDSAVCSATPFFVKDLSDEDELQQQCTNILDFVKDSTDRQKLLGVMLVDGLSYKDEWVAQEFSWALQGTPLVGGSAADNLELVETRVFFNASFHTNVALLMVLKLDIDFEIFKIQHFYPSQQRFVVTKAQPKKRLINEINGEPAALMYAKMLGKSFEELTPSDLTSHPLAVTLGGEVYIRSIGQVLEDKSLNVFGAVEEGTVFRVAQSDDLARTTLEGLDAIRSKFSDIEGVLSFACTLRRQEIYRDPVIFEKIKTYYSQYKLIGFHSYGEQYISKHVNQSLTGVFFGKKKSG